MPNTGNVYDCTFEKSQRFPRAKRVRGAMYTLNLGNYVTNAVHPPSTMKIATFNINNINRRLGNLIEWLETAKPDIVCLQELKCTDAEFPENTINRAGYHAVWKGQKTWNGVAILSKRGQPIVTRNALPGDAKDDQARYIEAAVDGILIGCVYLPNGNPQPGPKFDYKLAWFSRLDAHAKKLLRQDVPVLLAGDFNVAPTELDIYPTRSWNDDALVQPRSRAAFARLVKQGWTDAIREQHPNERVYTFWHYMRNRFARDAGLRLDHVLLNPSLATRLKEARIDRSVRAQHGASDHAPVCIVLKSHRRRRTTRASTKLRPRREQPLVPGT